MTAMFDTLKFARALRDGGQFTPEQSERLSDALSDAIAGEVVSRADLGATEAKLARRIDELEGRIDQGLKEVRVDLKAEIQGVKAGIKGVGAEIKGVQAEIKGVEAKIEAAKADTLKWIVGIIGFQSVAIIGAAIVLARILAC